MIVKSMWSTCTHTHTHTHTHKHTHTHTAPSHTDAPTPPHPRAAATATGSTSTSTDTARVPSSLTTSWGCRAGSRMHAGAVTTCRSHSALLAPFSVPRVEGGLACRGDARFAMTLTFTPNATHRIEVVRSQCSPERRLSASSASGRLPSSPALPRFLFVPRGWNRICDRPAPTAGHWSQRSLNSTRAPSSDLKMVTSCRGRRRGEPRTCLPCGGGAFGRFPPP